MHDLSVTLVQTDIHWENPVANRAMLEEKIWSSGSPGDVIILPEMFSTGFTMAAEKLAEVIGLQTFKWMHQIAGQTGALVLGSYIVTEHKRFYNRLVWMEPSGTFKVYDKRHLFRMAEEQNTFTGGDERLVAEWKGWRICPLVCYDLRFPVWSRNRYNREIGRMDYDLLVYCSNWPTVRIGAWDALLRARAVENLCYTAGVNRVGVDGNNIAFCGHSAIYDARGEALKLMGDGEKVETVTLLHASLHSLREKFPAFNDADDFVIQ